MHNANPLTPCIYNHSPQPSQHHESPVTPPSAYRRDLQPAATRLHPRHEPGSPLTRAITRHREVIIVNPCCKYSRLHSIPRGKAEKGTCNNEAANSVTLTAERTRGDWRREGGRRVAGKTPRRAKAESCDLISGDRCCRGAGETRRPVRGTRRYTIRQGVESH